MNRALELFAVLALASGCTPEIGDECNTAIDCSALGERLCDTHQPGGYCTIFNCEPDTCPDEASCVAFNIQLDPACGLADDGREGRFGKTFCMFVCEENDDCRAGYECVRPFDKFDGNATVVDRDTEEDNPEDTKMCLVAASVPEPPTESPDEPPPACFPSDGVGGLTPWEPGSGGAGGRGGQGGSGGAGGSGGSGGSGGTGGLSSGGAGGVGGN
jgi:hypothetical protein